MAGKQSRLSASLAELAGWQGRGWRLLLRRLGVSRQFLNANVPEIERPIFDPEANVAAIDIEFSELPRARAPSTSRVIFWPRTSARNLTHWFTCILGVSVGTTVL